MRARSAANSADSSPPSPDFTSSTMSSASCGSRGASRSVRWVSSSSTVCGELVDLGGERLVVGRQFAGGRQIATGGLQLAVGRHDRRQLREPPADLAGLVRRPSAGRGRRADVRGRRARPGWRRWPARCPSYRPPSRRRTPAASSPNANRRPACACAADRASVRQLFVGSLLGGLSAPALRLP